MDWHSILLGEEKWELLWEIPLRATVMFVAAIVMLRLLGKRAVPQGIFEVLIIVMIGSAAGDPLIYQGVGVLPAVISFILVVALYRLLNWITGKSKKAEELIEGKSMKLLTKGKFEVACITENALNKDDMFEELRLMHVSQLGQIRAAYIESAGQLSVFFAEEDQVCPGMPIYPECIDNPVKRISHNGSWACAFCGDVQEQTSGTTPRCSRCTKDEWIEASEEKRIA